MHMQRRRAKGNTGYLPVYLSHHQGHYLGLAIGAEGGVVGAERRFAGQAAQLDLGKLHDASSSLRCFSQADAARVIPYTTACQGRSRGSDTDDGICASRLADEAMPAIRFTVSSTPM